MPEEKFSRRKLLQDSTLLAVGAATLGGADAAATAQTEDKSKTEYGSWTVEKKNQVATIRRRAPGPGVGGDTHWELGEIFSDLRGDNSIRVIVLTGEKDGIFGLPPYGNSPGGGARVGDSPKGGTLWTGSTGLIRAHEAMVTIEKPIVAKVNGDAVGFLQSIIFASDLIVAREDAVLGDHHLAPVKVPSSPNALEFNTTPGDGGAAWLPLYMSPAKAKECLMLGKTYTAKELAQMGVINYAVPADQLDRVTEDIVQRLLQRSAYALAWTKRVTNAHYVDALNKTLSQSVAYEMVDLLQLRMSGGKIPTNLK